MVDFNKTPNPASDPEYLRLSQGTDRPTPNRAFGSLFEGIGQTVGVAVKQKDQENLDGIKNELYAGVDAIRDAQGVGTAVQTEGIVHTSSRDTPEAVTAATGTVDKLTQAYTAGKISDTSYWAKVESLVRSVRAKYPGYREEIDQRVASITGSTPANALRRSVLEDLTKAEAKAESSANRFETWERQNLEWIAMVQPDYFVRKANGNPYGKEYIINAVAQKQASVKEIDIGHKQLSYAEAAGSLTEKDAASAASAAADTFVWNALDTGRKTQLSNGKTFEQVVDEAISSGKPIDPVILNEVTAQINNLEAQVGLGLSKLMSQKNQDTGKSYNEYMRGNTNTIEGIKKNALSPITALKQAIATGDLAAATQYSRLATSMIDKSQAEALGGSKAIQTVAAIGKLPGGANIIPILLSSDNPQFLKGFIRDVVNINTASIATGNQDLDKTLDVINDKSKGNAAANRTAIDQTAKLLADPKVTDQAFVNVAKGVFGSQFFDKLDTASPDTKVSVFKQLVSPQVQKKMEGVKGTNPELYNQYTSWVYKTSGSIFRQQFSDLKEGIESTPYLSVTYDQKNNQFLYKVTKEGQDLLSKPSQGFGTVFVQPQIQSSINGIKQVNEMLQTISPILKANGQNVPQAMDSLFRDMGVNPNAPKQSTITGKLHRAIVRGTEAFDKNVEAGNKGKTEKPAANVVEAATTGFGEPDPQEDIFTSAGFERSFQTNSNSLGTVDTSGNPVVKDGSRFQNTRR